jgi:CRP-like cAMP-binding protein
MKNYIEKVAGRLDEAEYEKLISITTEITLLKDEFLLKDGQVCKNLWFLKKGAVKGYHILNGENVITRFFTEETFLTDYASVLTKTPTDLYFQATENCDLFQINYAKLESLYAQSHQLEHIGRIMAEVQFIEEYDRRLKQLDMDALERYEHLEMHQPEIFARFALKDIASYLGITPVSLSRLRKYRFSQRK